MSNTFQKFQSNETAQIQIPRVSWAGSEELQKETVATVSTAVQLLRDQKRGPDNTILLDRYVLVSRAALACALDDAVQKQYNRAPTQQLATFINRYGNFMAIGETIENRDTDVVVLKTMMVHGQLDFESGIPMSVPFSAINLRGCITLRKNSSKAYEKTLGYSPMEMFDYPFTPLMDLNAELLLNSAVPTSVAA